MLWGIPVRVSNVKILQLKSTESIRRQTGGESSALQTSRRRSGLPFAPSNNQNVATHKK